nr:hypothetical protein [Anaerolineae bacterium]
AGWAVGSDDTGNVGVILRYSSGTWTDDTPGAGVAGLNDVAVVSATEAWAVGEENSLLHFTGGSWNAVNLDLDDKFHLSAVSMLDANEGWAVGRFESGPSETGLFLHYSGGNWEPVSVEGDVVSTSDISAQDLDRSGLLDTIELHDVVMVSASEGYAVGDNGSILKYNGTGWQVISQGSASSLRAAAVTSSGLQVVGTNANILRVARVSGPLANTTYLPMVFRNPIPTRTPTSIPTPSRSKPEVLYYHDFRDTHHQWPHYTTSGIVGGDCKSLRDGGRYVLLTPSYSRHPCFRFAPEDANYRYGVFEARGYRAGGSDLLEWGIYVNGRGGSEYYLFRIRPGVNCGWEFVKREHDHDDVKRRGGCTGINKGANAIRIQHDRRGSSDVFALFINRQFVGEYSDRAGLNGDGTGFYLQARSSDYAEVRFDYFQVLSVPQ